MQFASAEHCCKVVMVPELVAEVCPSQSLYILCGLLKAWQTELLLPLAVLHAMLSASGRTDTETGSSAMLMVEKNWDQKDYLGVNVFAKIVLPPSSCCENIHLGGKSSRESSLPISFESVVKINYARQGGCFVKCVLFEISCKMNFLWLRFWGFFLSWIDAPARNPENRWPDHPFFPSLHRNVCWNQLSCSGWATA